MNYNYLKLFIFALTLSPLSVAQAQSVFLAKDPGRSAEMISPTTATDEDAASQTSMPGNEQVSNPGIAEASIAVAPGYDPVDPARAESILMRLKLVERLLRFGRAYDYRTVTTRELEKVLKDLEGAEAARQKISQSPSR